MLNYQIRAATAKLLAAKAVAKAAKQLLHFIAKAASGPVGWAFAVFDGISTILDLLGVRGYDNVQTIQH